MANEAQKIEWAINPAQAVGNLKPITDALTAIGIPPLSVSWSAFETMLRDAKNNRLCRGEYASIIFLTGDHVFDVLVIARRGDILDGILSLNFLLPRGASERDVSILFVNQICVAAHAKGLGTRLMAITDAVAGHSGLRAIQLIAGTSASNIPGPSGRPKLLQWYLNKGYNWVNQRRKTHQYPMLVKPLTAEGIAELARQREEGAAAEAAARAQIEAFLAGGEQYLVGGVGVATPPRGTPPPEAADGAGGAGGAAGGAAEGWEAGVPLPTGGRLRKNRKSQKSSIRSRRFRRYTRR